MPPVNYTYELFLDENGEKISKSIGNGIPVDDWLKFLPKEKFRTFTCFRIQIEQKDYFLIIPKNN